MITGIEHTGIMVSDMEKSLAFYGEVLGMDLVDRYLHPNGKVELAFLGLDGKVLIELIGGYPAEFANEGKVHHLAFSVTEIEQKFSLLKEKKVKLKDEKIIDLPNGKYFFFYGPDGESLEFFERK